MQPPKDWYWLGPISATLIGFYLYEHFGRAWEVIAFWQLPLAAISIEWGAYLWQAGIAYQNYYIGSKPQSRSDDLPQYQTQPKQEQTMVRDPGFVPLVRLVGQQVYNQTVEKPKFDMEREFAITLIRMRDFKPNCLAVDLREETWKRPNRFGSRDVYVAVRDKWERRGILGRKDARKNAPYIVRDWRQVQLIADGTPLPA